MSNDGEFISNVIFIRLTNLSSCRAFDVELLYIAEKLNIPVVEVDVNWEEIPGSKLDPFTASLQMGIDILAIWLRYFLGIWTIHQKKN